jgi:hypothetical protein
MKNPHSSNSPLRDIITQGALEVALISLRLGDRSERGCLFFAQNEDSQGGSRWFAAAELVRAACLGCFLLIMPRSRQQIKHEVETAASDHSPQVGLPTSIAISYDACRWASVSDAT